MPTPSQQILRPRTPEDTTTPSQSSFASCPPDEEREQHARGSERVGIRESTINSTATETSEAESVEHARVIMQQPTPEPESESSVGSHRISPPLEPEKADHIEDAGVLVDPASPTVGTPDTANDGDTHLVQSMLSTDISELSPASPLPQYLHFPELDVGRTTAPNSTSSFLRPGSKFKGTQQSDRQVYEVQVELKDVNLAESFLCGYLRIQGLTDDHPTLTTFFEGEIVGPKYLFKTQHPSWGSNEKVDLQHWARFPAWRPLAKSAKSPNFALKNNLDREHLFMRWKEYFLVPDHRVKTITGASFEGFYYICFNQCSGSVSGIYFHAKSEKYQRLELQHVDDRGCMPAMEFR